jgi:hypothetical protein
LRRYKLNRICEYDDTNACRYWCSFDPDDYINVAPSGLATPLVERGKYPLVILIQREDVFPVLL